MIPFAILSGSIIFKDRESLEVRILDLSPDSFTIRIPYSYVMKMNHVKEIVLNFYQYDNEIYVNNTLREFRIEVVEEEKYWVVFRLSTENSTFKKYSVQLMNEYMSYINYKRTYGDQIAGMLKAYPLEADDIYADDYQSQVKYWLDEIHQNYDSESWAWISHREIPLFTLLNHDELRMFLDHSVLEFQKNYWMKHHIAWHPLAKKKIEGVIVGNSFCPHLFPKESDIYRLIDKTKDENIKLILLFAPITVLKHKERLQLLERIHHYARQKNIVIEIQFNDQYMIDRAKKESWSNFTLSRGILLHKRTKDPRKKYRQDEMVKDNHDLLDRQIYLPYYQTNTATFCTLHASCKYGQRFHQYRVEKCPHYCKNHHFLYPLHLHMIGRDNSLFGIDLRFFTDGKILERYVNSEKEVVIDL